MVEEEPVDYAGGSHRCMTQWCDTGEPLIALPKSTLSRLLSKAAFAPSHLNASAANCLHLKRLSRALSPWDGQSCASFVA